MKTQKWIQRFAISVMSLVALSHAPTMAHAQTVPSYTMLDSWSFNDTNWLSDDGYAPVSFTNLVSVPDAGNGASLWIDGTNTAWLQYNCVENDGWTNLIFQRGSIIIWYAATNFSSVCAGGTGPGDWGELISVGSYTTNASGQWWSLYFDSWANNLVFRAQSNGVDVTYVSAPICVTNGDWHCYALTWDTNVSCLYMDGQPLATNGLGISIWPDTNTIAGGFFVGGSSAGNKLVRGLVDDLSTYDSPLDLGTIRSIAGFYSIVYDAMPLAFINPAPSSPTVTPTFDAITGIGNLTYLSNSLNCVTSGNVWLTNLVGKLGPSGTNMTLYFAIAGGTNTALYDVFANAALSKTDTNYQWAWMGQASSCGVYMLTNLPITGAFLMLGTPLDSDQDGLTDAYESLITHSNPHLADSSGDGMLDGWKVLWGLNPNVNNLAQPSQRSNYSYNLTDWLNTISGIRSGSVGLDPEGNVTSASQ